MGFERWGYKFEGAFTDPERLEPQSGVYVIWCKTDDTWTVIDVGESADVKRRVKTHDRAAQWGCLCSGMLYYSAIYTPNLQQPGRREIETAIRAQTKPPCGDW